MARIRSIHPGLTSDEAYMSMSMTAKAGWTPLWMQCDDHGIFEWKPIVLKALIFPADAVDFGKLLGEWLDLKCIMKVDIEGKPCGIVRNFAKYQRPKNPSYRYFKDSNLPAELSSYIAIKGAATPALPQPYNPTPEISPQREDGGGSGRMESGIEIEKEERVALSVSDSRPEKDRPKPIDSNYQPSDAAIEYAYSLGMKKADLNSELSKFCADGMAKRAVSFDLDASFKKRCDQWLDYQRRNPPKASAATHGPVAVPTDKEWTGYIQNFTANESRWPRGIGSDPMSAACRAPAQILLACGWDPEGRGKLDRLAFVEIETPEMSAHIRDHQDRKAKLPAIWKLDFDGVEKTGSYFVRKIPRGFDEATGGRLPPSTEEDAA